MQNGDRQAAGNGIEYIYEVQGIFTGKGVFTCQIQSEILCISFHGKCGGYLVCIYLRLLYMVLMQEEIIKRILMWM